MTEQEVRKLLRRMKEQDSQTAFRQFYDMTYDRLFRIAFYYLKKEEWSEEVVLDVFMKLWNQRANLPGLQNIEDFCFILVKNASLNYLEKEMKQPPPLSIDSSGEPGATAFSPEESLISEELLARYVKALDRLPERCREVFIRIREEKQSYAQVAEELNISINTVDAQLQKAVTRLKAIIRD
ncbi:RNA polymerase sigma-70 factor [Bacteroides pyogenes F0041]|uniref:RNA polymerase sigma-70 factor n=1 Tax=Bacteroides pyogenes F0041 TaxID=1321819 RepID=U2CCZ0_9BACE|nr:RNA polymerase sigma-70 factor [Bacteroides pyogenes]ERI88364.1 RNA polymerase sigma-70 factor [Bacteroides pyogenes F0041]MBB3896469.1 RNA polymerase sigma-70 factor (ECF subfamily) [Bacteroides pyogenes]GAE23762.1 RNA polymerase ECF-type sigma factor [Bacteroides pyogenes JCM 10003]SUV31233.1 RNA polymerase sigma factor, sigma-70 family/RNA polymerase sigma-70 factor, Bacteroides expansion family 1 [Bacteroides pyogenes]